MGFTLVTLGIALHGSLLLLLGPAPAGIGFQLAILGGQVAGLLALLSFRSRLPAAFWSVVTIGVTPLIASVAPLYPQATLVVVPAAFLLVLFTSFVMSRLVARLVAVEALAVTGFVILADPAARDLTVAELFFVLGTLATTHCLLLHSIETQAKLILQLQHAARTDSLTGLLTRSAIEDLARAELKAANKTSLVLLDVDRFKSVNDTYGHPAGDVALQHVARTLTEGVRHGDSVAGRLGGDEFAIVLKNCGPAAARRRAEELVASVARTSLSMPSGDKVMLGVSVGVATATGGDVETLYASADAALYAAKSSGRGRAASAPTHLR